MENEAKKIASEFLAAIQAGDMEKIGELVDPDVKWNQPGNNCLSGIKRSSTEVFQMVGKMYKISDDTLMLTAVKSICTNGNSVACLINWRAAKRSGDSLNVENIDVYTVENGQITEVNIFTADEVQENKFWGA